ncbi:MAG: hypothetical protein KJ072_15575 [Verrucomicrobia bacterium]|nr:hypothetical protein [Verrucomicrobiota bacterium]
MNLQLPSRSATQFLTAAARARRARTTRSRLESSLTSALMACALVLPLTFSSTASDSPPTRLIPAPLTDHPGNVFLLGDRVSIPVPEGLPRTELTWRLSDDTGVQRDSGVLPAERPARLALPDLGIGWYRVEIVGPDLQPLHATTAAVLAPLRSPTPLDSPISLDAAISWFAHDDPIRQEQFANLAALAGVNWLRDRLRWREIQPERDRLADQTSYDSAAAIQHRAGLRVLQVFHDTPPWAREPNTPGGRFATDLRAVHRFTTAMARRFRGRVQAWEPWNEANVESFGAHTVDEMCSWQKAAWLGFKAGDPNLIIGWNVTAAVPTPQHTEGIRANEVARYFDTYNIHTYDWFHEYDRLWSPARAATAGKPLWITEADRGMKHLNNPPDYDLPWPGERLKAEALIQEYACSLAAGAAQHFHFILGHYHEPNGVQFGLLRRDLTPRPAYVALAAVGRILAGARPLGRWHPGQDVTVLAFRARPDGEEADLLVIWAEHPVDWESRGRHLTDNPLPGDLPVTASYDYLGRDCPAGLPARIGSAPYFVKLAANAARQLPVVPLETQPNAQPQPPPAAPTDVCPLVLQILWPTAQRKKVTDLPWSEGHAYTFKPGESTAARVVAYNFGPTTARGTLTADGLPSGWTFRLATSEVQLAPGERRELQATFLAAPVSTESDADGWLRLRGDFGSLGSAVVAFRCVKE